VRIALYYVTQEALKQRRQALGASRARVELACGEAGFRLLIEDDGSGFDPAHSGAGQLGLGIMREGRSRSGGRSTCSPRRDGGRE